MNTFFSITLHTLDTGDIRETWDFCRVCIQTHFDTFWEGKKRWNKNRILQCALWNVASLKLRHFKSRERGRVVIVIAATAAAALWKTSQSHRRTQRERELWKKDVLKNKVVLCIADLIRHLYHTSDQLPPFTCLDSRKSLSTLLKREQGDCIVVMNEDFLMH